MTERGGLWIRVGQILFVIIAGYIFYTHLLPEEIGSHELWGLAMVMAICALLFVLLWLEEYALFLLLVIAIFIALLIL